MHWDKIYLTFLLLIIVLFFNHAPAEIIGNPPYKSIKIPTSAFGDHFDMVQDLEKTLYITYTNGIKIYDGSKWHYVDTGKDSTIRRLLFDQSSRVYFGGSGIFGYVYKDEYGVYQFKNITPESYQNKFDNIWHMTECNDEIVFIGLYNVFLFNKKDESIRSWDFKAKLGDGFCYKNKLVLQDREIGLVELENDSWVKNSIQLSNNKLIDKFQRINEDTFFVLSQSRDWRIIQNNKIKNLQSNKELLALDNYVSSASLGEGKLVLGTNNGLLTFIDINNLNDAQSFQLTNEWISKIIRIDDGLLILTEFEIFYLMWPSAIMIQGKDSGLASSIYDVKRWNDQLFVAGSAGVFLEDKQQKLSQNNLFRRLDWTNKEAWYILPINAEQALLAESHKIFLIKIENNETKIKAISETIYPRELLQSRYSPNMFFVITEFDFQLLMRKDGDWQLKKISSERPKSIIEESEGIFLMTTQGGNINQITIDLEQGEILESQNVNSDYLFDSEQNKGASLILTHSNKLITYHSQGIFELNKGQEPIALYSSLKPLLEGDEINKLIQADNGLFYGMTFFKFFYQDKLLEWHVIDLSQYLQGSIGVIRAKNDEIKLLSSGTLITYFANDYTEPKTSEYSLRMTKILLKQNHTETVLPLDPEYLIEFDQGDATLIFSSVLNDVRNHSKNRYRFKLSGEADGWSDFTKNSQLRISNLSAGEYSLNIEAKDVNNKLYSMPSYHFVVNPPWYLSGLAKILWSIIFLLVLGLLFNLLLKWKEKVHESQKQVLKQIINSKTLELKKANANLQKMAHLDGLTGLSNRFHLDEFIKNITRNEVTSVVVMMLDMDDFKQYNDNNGHIAGDELLKKMAQYLSQVIDRPGDIVARYGGEEFLVVLVDCDIEFAQSKAEEIRQYIEDRENKTSISIGLCQSSSQSDIKRLDDIYHLIDKADQALYEAKKAGRNRVVLCE
jgi:diguanylate cyclase (GGDEF)-like protein